MWYLVATFSALLVQTLLIIWLVLTRVQRRKAETESARLALVAATEHKRLEEVVSNVPGVVWETRFDEVSGRFTTIYVSDYVEKLLGYSAKEWQSGFGLTLLHDEDRDRVITAYKSVLSEKLETAIQFRWLARDGNAVWVEAHLAPVVDQGKAIGLRGVTLNITEQKLAEANYREVFNAATDAIFILALDGTIIDSNARMLEMYGYTREEANYLRISDLTSNEPSYTEAEAFKWIEKAVSGEPQLLEWLAKRKSGELFWIEVNIKRTRIGPSDVLLSIVRDITDRKRSVDQLRASEERFGKAFRSNPQPMSITTLSGGLYLDVNESFLNMSGYTREEVIGHTSLELKIWETPEARVEFVQLLCDLGSVVNFETKFRTKSRFLRTLLSSAEKVDIAGEQCLLIASSDITARMEAQQALRESEERFRNMADTAPVMIWTSNTENQCTYVNKPWLNFTGRSLDQELGDGWAEAIHAEDYERCLQVHASSYDSKKAFEIEFRLRRNDGEYRWVFDTGTPRLSAAGVFLGYVGSCIDITERRQSEEALKKAHVELNALTSQLAAENIYLQEELHDDHVFGDIVGQSKAIKHVLYKVSQVGPTDTTVLISGDTGTGKELVARAIHGASLRKDRTLIKVNCGALSPTLIESELFGHEKGAFTGAGARKLGRFELASGGTLFLDEIGELPLELQVKLLRVIQEGELERLGGTKTIKTDVRIIAATNRNLKHEVQKGTFREDLWYRLDVFPITVPLLRERPEDIPLMVEYFAGKFANKYGKKITSISPHLMNGLQSNAWPGNVRELANVIERAVINSTDAVLRLVEPFDEPAEPVVAVVKTLEENEREYIRRVLEKTRWRVEGPQGAAKILGINPSTLRTRMLKLGIQKPNQLSLARNVS
jgi:PAS domain S-box-containing protein